MSCDNNNKVWGRKEMNLQAHKSLQLAQDLLIWNAMKEILSQQGVLLCMYFAQFSINNIPKTVLKSIWYFGNFI